jgi:pimeloyl-ACP methyl ester carboxylesterase
MEADCGRLSVPEDPENPGGRQIDLNIAVISAISRKPAPDPLFFIAGGPGEAATQSYLSISDAFEQVNQKREIILVDQRGTGGSNPLRCDFSNLDIQADVSPQEVKTSIEACLQDLDADPRFYTTTLAVRDLDRVREAMGFDKINLYGVSYGTRVALDYLHQYPERVRSVILDGVVPPNWSIGPDVAADAQRALDMIFERCQADSECNQAFPNLTSKFGTLLKTLEAGPVDIQLPDPISGEGVDFHLSYDFFASTIHTLSYSPESSALIPLLIDDAFQKSDYSKIAAQGLADFDLVNSLLSNGMRFSIVCTEDVPYYAEAAYTEGYLGESIIRSFEQVCQFWPNGTLPTDFRDPVSSDAPVLILSGEADPVTPPENGAIVAQNLPNSLHLILTGQGHGNIFRGCIPSIAADFIESGTISGLDTACTNQIEPLPFFLNFNGPTP